MRIAFLSLHIGGMAHYACSMALSLSDRHTVAYFGPTGTAGEHLPHGIEAHLYDIPQWTTPHELSRIIRAPLIARAIERDICGWSPDILHVNSGHILYPLFLSRLAGRIPMVSTIHDVDPHLGESRPVEHLKLGPLLKHSRAIMVHSDTLRELAIRRWDLAPEHVTVVPHGQFDVFKPWASGREAEPGTLLLYGRLREYKGIRILLEALPHIVAQHPETKLIIAGQGDLRPYMDRIRAHQANVEIINRFLSEKESAALFERAAILLAPYLEASQSGIPFIAASFQRPIIASRIGAIPEIVRDGETGLLTPPGEAQSLAKAINALLSDPQQQQRMGRRAACFMREQFGIEVTGRRLEALYAAAVPENVPG